MIIFKTTKMGSTEIKAKSQRPKNLIIRPAPGYRGIKIFSKHKLHIYDTTTSAIYV
jgi:hypothetical protein